LSTFLRHRVSSGWLRRTKRAGSEESLLLRALPSDVFLAFDPELRYSRAGGDGLAAAGFTSAVLVGKTIFEVLPSAQWALVEEAYRTALSGQPAEIDADADGRVYHYLVAPVRDDDGQVVGGLAVGQEVTQARRIEHELRGSEERFRTAFERAPVGMALISLAGHYVDVNLEMCLLSGLSEEQMLHANIADFIEPEALAVEMAGNLSLLDGTQSSYTVEKQQMTAAGELQWREKSVSLVHTADGSPLHFISNIQDVTERVEQDLLLSEERRRLAEAQSIGLLGSWEVDVETGAVTWSQSMFDLYGLDPRDNSGRLPDAIKGVYPADRAAVAAGIEDCAATGNPFRVQYRWQRPSDGALRWFDARGQALDDGGRRRLVGAAVDVTDLTAQLQAEAEAQATSAFQQAVISASPDIVYVYDIGRHATVWTNRPLTELLGYSSEQLQEIGEEVIERLIPASSHALYKGGLVAVTQARDDEVVHTSYEVQHADGKPHWLSQRSTPMRRDADGHVTQVVGALRDITDSVGQQRLLEHNSLHDSLTGLPNRALLVDRLDAALARSHREQRNISVLFCDLDGFKRVNDSAGHAAGDAVLIEVAARIATVLREGDTVARVGGDEFVIVVEPWDRVIDVTGARDAESLAHSAECDQELAVLVAERVAAALRRPVQVNQTEHVVSASIGITHAGPTVDGSVREFTADQLLRDADAAMFRAKNQGRDRFEIFEQGMSVDLAERGRIEQVLRAALDDGVSPPMDPERRTRPCRPELAAAYQPVFRGGDGQLVSFEALARLTDADGLAIDPEVAISVAEDTGLIHALGARMLELACRQLAAWRADAPELATFTMAVNVSTLQAQRSTWGAEVRGALTRHRLAASDLVLELTETALLRAAHSTLTNLRRLRDEGVGIAIDDFGTGYASLRYLATLPVTSVKVDQSFTAGLPRDETCCKIVKAVAGLAADMWLTCIVEGVETESQRAALPAGVHVQGWLTGRPAAPDLLDLRGLVHHGSPAAH
jgi:diguanylate cyclase (GGDEF)-like protein/PAS domain S-box-containing protein